MRATVSLPVAAGATGNVAGLVVSTEAQAKNSAGGTQSSADMWLARRPEKKSRAAAPNKDEIIVFTKAR